MNSILIPAFLKRTDRRLLENAPVTWMSRIHYVLWYGCWIWISSALLGMFLPVNLKINIEYEVWHFLLTVMAVVVMCFWIYRYVIFNREKNYGISKPTDEFLNLFLVFVSVSIFLISPWPFEIIYNARIASMYSPEEIIDDMNRLNKADPYMVDNYNTYFNWYDSTDNRQYVTLKKLNPHGNAYYTSWHLRGDSVRFPDLLTDAQLSKHYKPLYTREEVLPFIRDFIRTASKYGVNVDQDPEQTAENYLKLVNQSRVQVNDLYGGAAHQYELTTVFNNLCKARFATLFIFNNDYLWTMFYFIISISSFLLLFKMNYWRQFLIMCVIVLLYPLITFIFSQLLPYRGFLRGTGFYMGSLLLLLLFSLFTVYRTVTEKKVYLPFYNIFNQLFFVSLIYFPMLILGFLHEATDLFHHQYSPFEMYSEKSELMPVDRLTYEQVLNNYLSVYWEEQFQLWLKITKYAGIMIFITALPFFRELFIKQLSLPQRT